MNRKTMDVLEEITRATNELLETNAKLYEQGKITLDELCGIDDYEGYSVGSNYDDLFDYDVYHQF